MWFQDPRSVWLNGGSGRFPPQSASELEEAVEAFIAAGYRVASGGWDKESGKAARFFRGNEPWKP